MTHDLPAVGSISGVSRRFTVADLSDEYRAQAIEACGPAYVRYLQTGICVETCSACGRSKPVRTAINAFTKLLVEAGKARDMVQEMVRALGRPLPEATKQLEAVDRAQSLDASGRARLWARSLEQYCRENGIQGLVIPAVLLSRAEVVE